MKELPVDCSQLVEGSRKNLCSAGLQEPAVPASFKNLQGLKDWRQHKGWHFSSSVCKKTGIGLDHVALLELKGSGGDGSRGI